MSSTKQLMQGWSNTGWSIRDSSCRNCHHYDRVGTYLRPHHRIGHNLECGSCNIRLGTQHLPAIHVRVLRDKWLYRAVKNSLFGCSEALKMDCKTENFKTRFAFCEHRQGLL